MRLSCGQTRPERRLEMAFFVAFYSYKGGVGRTLALANVAWSLAAAGKKVVLVDMDLEAPSLDGYRDFRLGGKKRGFLEYAEFFHGKGKTPPIEKHVFECKKAEVKGRLWLMPAGRHDTPEYQKTLGSLPWRRLHEVQGTQAFVAALRQDLEAHFKPDYVLIDARTGLSDVGGLSTNWLADLVVLVFNLTETCIAGSAHALGSFISPEPRKRKVELVASPVPSRDSLVEERLKMASRMLHAGLDPGGKILTIDYEPAMALVNQLAVQVPDRFKAAALSYSELFESVRRANAGDAFGTLERVTELRASTRVAEAVELLENYVANNPQDGQGIFALGQLHGELGRYERAVKVFSLAEGTDIFRREADAFFVWGFCLDEVAQLSNGAEQIALYQQATDRYRQALAERASSISPHSGDYNRACALSRLERFDAAREVLEAELERQPDLRRHALDDPDLAGLWTLSPDFRREVEAALRDSSESKT
jgi:cellulose biosynthesis protein BcsQ